MVSLHNVETCYLFRTLIFGYMKLRKGTEQFDIILIMQKLGKQIRILYNCNMQMR